MTSYTIRWFVTLFVGLVFAAAGSAKVFGDPVFTAWFQEWGFPVEYMRALGVVEIVGAMALAVPPLARHAILGLFAVAAGATLMQLAHGSMMDAMLPMLLAVAAAIRVWGTPNNPVTPRGPQVLAPRRRTRRSSSRASTLTTALQE